jgi:hypothetical protein
MIVKELIEFLQTCNPELPVVYSSEHDEIMILNGAKVSIVLVYDDATLRYKSVEVVYLDTWEVNYLE